MRLRLLSWVLAIPVLACTTARTAVSPAAALDELLATDRAFATASAASDVVTGLSTMFASDVVFLYTGRVAHGVDSATALLRATPANATAHMTWRPIGGQVAASGDVGYTYGYFRVDTERGTTVAGKYLSFWTRTAKGWRVAAYKRAVGPRSDTLTVSSVMQTGEPVYHAAGDSTQRASALHDAEARFSDLAQTVSLGEAFRRTAAPDAVHTANPNQATFSFGPDAIKAGIDANGPPPGRITWGSVQERVARSGDIGLTTGWIVVERPNDTPIRIPYFTIWKAATDGTWRFAAE